MLQCGGIWIGGKGWGVTWKLVQAVVKPKEVVSVFGKCHINLSTEDKQAMETEDVDEDDATPPAVTDVADSDDEAPAAKKAKVVEADVEAVSSPKVTEVVSSPKVGGSAPAAAPKVTEAPAAAPVVVKKVVKKVVSSSK